MASSLIDKICEDLCCGICLEILTRPKMLPCQHTFCQGCIGRGLAATFFRCPYCRQLARLPPQGVAGFPDNRMAASLCEKVRQQLGERRPHLPGSGAIQQLDADHSNNQGLPRIGEGMETGEFEGPVGLAVSEEGEIFVADTLNQRIQVFTLQGMFVRQFPTVVSPGGERMDPRDVALDGKGYLWVVGKRWEDDLAGFAVQYMKQGTVLRKFDLQGTRWFRGVAVDTRRNRILITQTTGDWDNLDKLRGEVQVFHPDGTLVETIGASNTWWGLLSRQQQGLKHPLYLTVDRDGNILVTDCDSHCVFAYSEDGQFLFRFGGEGSGEGQLSHPHGVCTDSSGNIAVADTGNDRVELFDRTGKFLRHLSTEIKSPRAVAMATGGQLVVTDVNHIATILNL
ncbi:uncharacterized protein LOC144921465 [Branchiostoma floridae x Branchiostoma belcheri]